MYVYTINFKFDNDQVFFFRYEEECAQTKNTKKGYESFSKSHSDREFLIFRNSANHLLPIEFKIK